MILVLPFFLHSFFLYVFSILYILFPDYLASFLLVHCFSFHFFHSFSNLPFLLHLSHIQAFPRLLFHFFSDFLHNEFLLYFLSFFPLPPSLLISSLSFVISYFYLSATSLHLVFFSLSLAFLLSLLRSCYPVSSFYLPPSLPSFLHPGFITSTSNPPLSLHAQVLGPTPAREVIKACVLWPRDWKHLASA